MPQVTVGVSLKTYFGHERARTFFTDVAQRAAAHPAVVSGDVRLFIIPTYLQIPAALDAFAGTPVLVGAQDVSQFGPGAYTGEVTAAELAEVGVAVAEIGHAERRRLFDETDTVAAAKAAAALTHGIAPVLCVGEASRVDPVDAATATVAQLAADLTGAPAGPVIVAYEPVWAIGTGRTATAAQADEAQAFIRARIGAKDAGVAERLPILYGGSVKAANAAELFAMPNVDGALVGGASIVVEEFASICRYRDHVTAGS